MKLVLHLRQIYNFIMKQNEKKKRVRPRVVGKDLWRRYENYNPKMLKLVEDKFGTVSAFAEALGVTLPTCYGYMRTPLRALDRNQDTFKKMCGLLSLNFCDAIEMFNDKGEGEE